MKRIFSALGMIGLLLMSACGGKGKTDSAETDGRDSTYTTVQHPEWSRNAVIYEVNLRQYSDSGNVASFTRDLPRLKELGVDILWFMPIHPISKVDRKGTLGSYYAVADYKAFNPEFGTVEQFKDMVKKAHEQGQKVIIDWVPNHSGRDNVWVSEHPDWYQKDSLGNMKGIYDWTDVYVFDFSNAEMRKGMIDAMKYWVTEVGVDGFRCDYADGPSVEFWEEAGKALKEAKPDIFMLAEAAKPEIQKNVFDMAYNWPMKDLFSAIAATNGQYTFKGPDGKVHEFDEKHATDITRLLEQQAVEYPKDTYLMNMITNHDLNSWEGTEFDRLGNLANAFAVLTYTLPGMPLIYTGQETGMNRAFEFFEKDKAPEWEPRNEYFTFYQRLNGLKHSQKALAAGVEGGEVVVYPTDNQDLYVFSREKDGSEVIVFANLGKDTATVNFTGDKPSLDGKLNFFTAKPAEMPSELAAGDYMVVVKN